MQNMAKAGKRFKIDAWAYAGQKIQARHSGPQQSSLGLLLALAEGLGAGIDFT